MSFGIKRNVSSALSRVLFEIKGMSHGSLYAGGLASEGYAGGYAQALRDVQLALNGIKPQTRDYWQDFREPKP